MSHFESLYELAAGLGMNYSGEELQKTFCIHLLQTACAWGNSELQMSCPYLM